MPAWARGGAGLGVGVRASPEVQGRWRTHHGVVPPGVVQRVVVRHEAGRDALRVEARGADRGADRGAAHRPAVQRVCFAPMAPLAQAAPLANPARHVRSGASWHWSRAAVKSHRAHVDGVGHVPGRWV